MSLRILAATDLSAPSRYAVARAYRLAAELDAELALIHAISPGIFSGLQELLGQQGKSESQSLDDAVAAEALKRLEAFNLDPAFSQGIHATPLILRGKPIEIISQHARNTQPDLLVLGARGEGFMRQWMLGSTASRLLRKIQQSLLVVKQSPHEPYRRALIATDFSAASLTALRRVRDLFPDISLVLLHAVELPFEGKMQYANVDPDIIQHYRIQAQLEGMRKLRELAVSENLPDDSTQLLALIGNPAQLILEIEQEQNCDLIAIGKHGVNIAEELLLGSTTKHILGESQGDVLVSTVA